MKLNLSNYAKHLAVAATAAIVALQPFYGSKPWFVAVLAAAGTLGVMAIPAAKTSTTTAASSSATPGPTPPAS